MFQDNVAATIRFYNTSEHNVATGIGFTAFPNRMLLEPLVSQQLRNGCCLKHLFYNSIKGNVAKTIGVTTIANTMLLN